MTYDEVLVTIVKAATVNEINNRLYHLEVYQTNEKLMQFPCTLYNLRSNHRLGDENSGSSGFFCAEYELVVIAKDSDTIRTIGQKIFDLHEEDPNETNLDAYGQYGYQWLDIMLDQENVEYAVELESKGYKTATHLMLLYHAELENNARSS